MLQSQAASDAIRTWTIEAEVLRMYASAVGGRFAGGWFVIWCGKLEAHLRHFFASEACRGKCAARKA